MGDELEDQVGDRLRMHWMPGDWFPCSPEAVSHYAAKARVCAKHKPLSVIEIGTRCGYSLASFHVVAPDAKFFCVDGAIDADSPACLQHWQSVVDSLGIDAQLIVANSHDLQQLPPADFAHVDGDHSYAGALADLRLVAHVPVILADDCDNPDVERAVEEFCAETGREPVYFHDGLRKAAVLVEA
jgi:cephalosporin hydroxylase